MENIRNIEIPSVGKRLATLVAASALAASFAAAPAAFAVDASAGENGGSGTTSVTVQLASGNNETGGAGSEGNPDADDDGYGDNIAFSVPTSINFVADADGALTGPTNVQIQNLSKFAIHGSSLQVQGASGWNIVSDASLSNAANAIDFQVGPTGDLLNAYDYTTKAAVGDATKWDMAANSGAVSLSTSGDINNVTANIAARTQVATMHWYVTPGTAS